VPHGARPMAMTQRLQQQITTAQAKAAARAEAAAPEPVAVEEATQDASDETPRD
jgi:hypothetical protein